MPGYEPPAAADVQRGVPRWSNIAAVLHGWRWIEFLQPCEGIGEREVKVLDLTVFSKPAIFGQRVRVLQIQFLIIHDADFQRFEVSANMIQRSRWLCDPLLDFRQILLNYIV